MSKIIDIIENNDNLDKAIDKIAPIDMPTVQSEENASKNSTQDTKIASNKLYSQSLLQRQLQVQYDFAPLHPSRIEQLKDLDASKTMYFPVESGRFYMTWNNPNGRLWTFPKGTVKYGTTTEILTSTETDLVDVIIPTGGGVVTLTSDNWNGNYKINCAGITTPLLKLNDIPKLTHELYLAGITDDLANLSTIPLDFRVGIAYTSGMHGSLPVPTDNGWKPYLLNFSSSFASMDVADSIVNMASYWNGKTAPSGASLNLGVQQAEYDVTTEVTQLVSAGFTVTYVSH